MGILRDIDEPEEPTGSEETLDIGPAESPTPGVMARQDPMITGSGRTRPLSSLGAGMTGGSDGNGTGNGNGTGADWESDGRNDPCPCGSGKKFKKCHGARV
jgi:preprotein translocase subunit SecA